MMFLDKMKPDALDKSGIDSLKRPNSALNSQQELAE